MFEKVKLEEPQGDDDFSFQQPHFVEECLHRLIHEQLHFPQGTWKGFGSHILFHYQNAISQWRWQ